MYADQELYETGFEELEGEFEGAGGFGAEELEGEGEYGEGETGAFSPNDELDLAAEMLSVSNEAELDQFLGKLIGRAVKGVRRFAMSPTGMALGGILKNAARKALPVVGRALGTAVGGPVGGALGGRLASAAGRAFGLELEGMSPEDQELEVARGYVRFAGAAAQQAAMAPRSAPPRTIAMTAARAAAQRYAPGLYRPTGSVGALPTSYQSPYPTSYPTPRRRSGRWVRRGHVIVLLGV